MWSCRIQISPSERINRSRLERHTKSVLLRDDNTKTSRVIWATEPWIPHYLEQQCNRIWNGVKCSFTTFHNQEKKMKPGDHCNLCHTFAETNVIAHTSHQEVCVLCPRDRWGASHLVLTPTCRSSWSPTNKTTSANLVLNYYKLNQCHALQKCDECKRHNLSYMNNNK